MDFLDLVHPLAGKMKQSSKEAMVVKRRALTSLQRVHDLAASERRVAAVNSDLITRMKRFEIEPVEVNHDSNGIGDQGHGVLGLNHEQNMTREEEVGPMDIGPSRKEILHVGPNAADGPSTNRKRSGMEATTRVSKIRPADGRLNGGPGIKGTDEVNSKDGSAALIHGQNVQNSKNSGGEAKKGVMPNSWASLFGSTGVSP